ncbi:GDSL esterase/lipase At5g45920 [Nymphaea colorata]|nr:GDSL esterase/lipase At5g45920 [Nymphaea colorata]XP_031472742.1 GDSL esterase/lipase At5g45920 [Nymphaea colorata]XP_031472750.1 GDSL esterase/lipase At5g45920 [Nymphaea colorata]
MRPKIVLFGDSITEESFAVGGWGACLANHFSRTADVVLRGYSGYNTRWALRVLDRVLSSVDSPPAALTIFFGANDASLPDRSSAFQHVPLHEYRQNLIDLIARIKGRWGATVIVLLAPPPIDEEARLRDPYGGSTSGLPERTNQSAGLYAESCISAGRDSSVPVVDLWTKMQTIPGWQKAYLRDGLHLTADGNKVVFDELVETLKKEGLSVASLPSDLPLLSEIDPRDPLKSFPDTK